MEVQTSRYSDATMVTELLRRSAAGDREALDRAVHMLYDELQRLAHAQRARWHGDETLETTALCHEAYLKIVGQGRGTWRSRTHFMSVAARAMRQILIDYARARQAEKRGGGAPRIPLEDLDGLLPSRDELSFGRAATLIELEDGLKALEKDSPRHAKIVECRFFGGMTIRETADALEISPTSVKRGWALAQTWLHQRLSGPPAEPGDLARANEAQWRDER